jgi:uncharacterized protein (TIGR02145 family)
LDPVIDADGNVYKTTTYETMTWMTENLKTSKYNDGSLIPEVTDRIAWINQTSPAFCWYNNDSSTYKDSFGALYNWYSVNTGKLCPIGWHVSTYIDWSILVDILSRNSYGFDGGISTNIAKSLASKVGWKLSETVGAPGNNSNSNNLSGFTGIPTGTRFMEGYFLEPINALWWIRNTVSTTFTILYWSSMADLGDQSKDLGFPVRCVKN